MQTNKKLIAVNKTTAKYNPEDPNHHKYVNKKEISEKVYQLKEATLKK